MMATENTNQHEEHNSVLGGIGSVGHGLVEAASAGMSAAGHLDDFVGDAARWVGDRAERGLAVLTGSEDDYKYWDKYAQANADLASADLRQAGQDLFGTDGSPSASNAQAPNGVSNTMDASASWPSGDSQSEAGDTQSYPTDTQDYGGDGQEDAGDSEDADTDTQDDTGDSQDDTGDDQYDAGDDQYDAGDDQGDSIDTQDDPADGGEGVDIS